MRHSGSSTWLNLSWEEMPFIVQLRLQLVLSTSPRNGPSA